LKKKAKEFDSIKIVRYESSVFYANVENFSYKITKLSGVNATEISQRINKLKSDHEKFVNKSNPSKVIVNSVFGTTLCAINIIYFVLA